MPVRDTPIKSPYGTVEVVLQTNSDHYIAVMDSDGAMTYYFSPNWTRFETDRATQITEAEFNAVRSEMHAMIMAELARRQN